ncbi:MAG: HD domain-containing protein [Candidatus Helarchaeota archaeon]
MNKAKKFAEEKHKNQKRKYHDEPYISHPLRVMEELKNYTNDEDMLIAALLHDTIEDTETTYEEILKEFGVRVANFVMELTSDKNEAKKIGKDTYLANKMNNMSEKAFLIKLCDRFDNVSGLEGEPKDFVDRYKKETANILKNIKRNLSPIHKDLIKKIWKKIS